MRFLLRLCGVAALLVVAGCSGVTDSTTSSVPLIAPPTTPEGGPPPELDAKSTSAGADLYDRFCSSCHGADLAGDPDWKTPYEDGSYPPPPQDSSGHTWHHGDDLLLGIILDGYDLPESRMPAFGEQLTEAEVLSILDFFKSIWGPRERAFQWEATLRERAAS